MEMLVALTIIAMTMALGMQALMQWNRAQERFSEAERRGREILLSEQWIRGALRSRLARSDAASDGQPLDLLEGEAKRLSFVTLSPIGGRRGVPARQTWLLVDTPDGQRLDIEGRTSLRLPADASARFVFVDGNGEVHERWPPRKIESATFPAMVGLSLGSRLWIESQPLRPVTVPHEDIDE
jgi:type II secretory pathway pseudopilin PulG